MLVLEIFKKKKRPRKQHQRLFTIEFSRYSKAKLIDFKSVKLKGVCLSSNFERKSPVLFTRRVTCLVLLWSSKQGKGES